MDNHDDQHDEPIILSLEAFRNSQPEPDGQPPHQAAQEAHPVHDEEYWAGRNLAMRRSARWAA